MCRAALECADGTLAGGMLREALDGMPAVPLHGMGGARPRAVHPMTSEAVTALCLEDALGRQPVSVDRPVRADNDRNRRRCMPGDDALRGQRKRYPGEHEYHHHRSEEHTSELQSLMRISYAVFCLKKKRKNKHNNNTRDT